jgi:hypothetical protein
MGNLYDQLKKIKVFFKGDDKKNQSNKSDQIASHNDPKYKNKRPKVVNTFNFESKEPSPKNNEPKKVDIKFPIKPLEKESVQPVLNKASELFVESEIIPKIEKKLYRQQFFKFPDTWVEKGCKTQISKKDLNDFVDIYIGVDFGTSFTKAAVGFMDKIYPVDWAGVSNFNQKYLLPSEYSIFSDESIFIGQHPKANYLNLKGDLKLPFINNKNLNSEHIDQASIFLALIIRYIRGWTYQSYSNLLNKKNIRWHLNLGAPSNGLEDSSLKNIYLSLAKYSWDRSVLDKIGFLQYSNYNSHRECLDLISVEIFPEFVAQMAGYMQSSQRLSGLHALIDVGGGTLDVVTYIVHQDQEKEDVFPFLVPEVKPMGTQILNLKRFEIKEVRQNKLAIDELAPILDAYSFAKFASVPSKLVTNVDDIFSEKISELITNVFRLTKNRRYRLSNAWETGVRTFFTGGGSNSSFYKNAINNAKSQSKGGLILTLLPKHPKLDKFSGDDKDYQRISVACGLAQDSFTLGKVKPAKEVEDDIAPPAQPSLRERLDRDDLYPK